VFNGEVTGFARDDLDAQVPLFHVALVGQGRVNLSMALFDDGLIREPEVTYTFAATAAPIPEPTTLALFGIALIGMGARAWTHRRTPHNSWAAADSSAVNVWPSSWNASTQNRFASFMRR
jgi:hypothetical protein